MKIQGYRILASSRKFQVSTEQIHHRKITMLEFFKNNKNRCETDLSHGKQDPIQFKTY